MTAGEKMRVAVTGGAGFIGSHLCEHLAAAGHPVLAIDDLSRGRRENLPPAIPLEVRGIGDPALGERLAAFAPQALVHLAAQVDARRSLEDPVFDAEVNILDTVRLFAAAVAAGVERIVFASSAAVYGDPEEIPTPEESPLAPLSPYGVAKLAGEGYLAFFARRHGLTGVALRFANVYGPRQESVGEAGVVAVFCQRLLAGEPVTIHGDGRQSRDFVYVEDVAAACLRALSGPPGVYNVATGVETDVRTLHARLATALRPGAVPAHGPPIAGEPRRSALDPSRAERGLDFRARTGLADGLARTAGWFHDRSREKR
ncbi:MAG: NAD-dependent epimerase/dehydratase family protein [Thermoanaerobaculia bacterium]